MQWDNMDFIQMVQGPSSGVHRTNGQGLLQKSENFFIS
jgi:hypothetical protein